MTEHTNDCLLLATTSVSLHPTPTLQIPGRALQVQERFGVTIDVIEETPEGDLDIAHLESLLAALEPGVFALVSVSHIPTSSGRVYDAVAVGRAVAKHPGACQRSYQVSVHRLTSYTPHSSVAVAASCLVTLGQLFACRDAVTLA